MEMFKRNGSGRSSMEEIEFKDVIKDIRMSSIGSKNAKDLMEDGYLSFIKVRDDFDSDICYYIKPTKAVEDYMMKKGYGTVDGVAHSDVSNTISFHSLWKSARISMTTTPQIAGVLNPDDLQKKLKTLKYEGDCQVNKAYLKMYSHEPNYSLKYINLTGKTLENMKELSQKMWLAVGFMLGDDEITKKAKNGDYDLAYNDPEKMKFLDEKFKFDKPFYIPDKPSDRKRTTKIKRN